MCCKKKSPFLHRNSNHRPSSPWPSHYTEYVIRGLSYFPKWH